MDISDDKRRYFIPPESMGTLFTIPLFDSSVSRKNGFFEFNLYAKKIDKDEESSNSVKLNYPLVKCSVCNIPVPKSRMKEHIRSPKHKLCLQIIEVSLDRVKYLIMAENECDKAIVPADSYFCEPCALDVENKDKINHESTNDHHRRVMHDKLLKDLLLAFKSVDYLNNLDIIKDAPEVDVLAETVQTDTVKTQAKIVSTKQDTNESSTLDMADYIDLLKNIFKSAPMPRISVDNGLVKIVALDHSEIKVPFDHFNAFFKRDGYTQCRVCLILVEDVQAHMLKTEHMKKVLLPLQNKHCIRQVDQTYSHCVLCNMLFCEPDLHKEASKHFHFKRNKYDLHVNSKNHLKSVANIVHDGSLTKDYGTSTCSSQNDCNDSIDVALSQHKEHIRTGSHETESRDFNQGITNGDNEDDTNELKELKNLMVKIDEKRIACKICRVEVPYHYNNVFGHVIGKKHVNHHKKILKQYNIKIIRPDILYCNTCDLELPVNEELEHVLGHIKAS